MDDVIVLLQHYRDEYEALLAADILENNGIPSQLVRETAGGFKPFLGGGSSFRLYVRAEHVDEAREYLGAYETPVEGDGSPS